jgi:nucleoside-diphosphate-sugar epimerase
MRIAKHGRVLVTGGEGRLGAVVVADLVAHGYEVISADRERRHASPQRFLNVDFTDHGQVMSMFAGVDGRFTGIDAVVHLAAIPAPGIVPNSATFENNMLSSYNVFTAALAAGVKNIVWASSETVLGLPFDEAPPYVPLDEEYRVRPNSTYSMVKAMEEELAFHLCRQDPDLKMYGMRFSNVMLPDDYARFPAFDADPDLRKWNLWCYIDARDGAQACRKALEHDAVGFDVFIIANTDSVMERDSVELVRQYWPDMEFRKALGRHESLMSTAKAHNTFGYAPEHSWRQ